MPDSKFLIAGLTIVLIDLLLAGDNALVIALAVRSLPQRERRIGTACGAALAVVLRVGLTFLAVQLLDLEYVQLAGALFILWIAYRVLIDASDPPKPAEAPKNLMKAIGYVVLADLTMSVDNIIAIAAASHGHLILIIFGLGLSIPFVVFSSNLLVTIMDRFPITIYLGAAILGMVAGDLAISDPFIVRTLHPGRVLHYAIDATLIAIVLIAGRLHKKWRKDST
jgi:YjbE family integral membrane protein